MSGLREFPENVKGLGDVLSHMSTSLFQINWNAPSFVQMWICFLCWIIIILGQSVDLDFEGKKVHVTMVPNPSHLEVGNIFSFSDKQTSDCINLKNHFCVDHVLQAVNPVAMGKTRARLQRQKSANYATSDENKRHKSLCLQIHGDAAFAGQVYFMLKKHP